MLAEFEWLFRSTFEWALEDHAASGATIARKEFQEVLAAAGSQSVRTPAASSTEQVV